MAAVDLIKTLGYVNLSQKFKLCSSKKSKNFRIINPVNLTRKTVLIDILKFIEIKKITDLNIQVKLTNANILQYNS